MKIISHKNVYFINFSTRTLTGYTDITIEHDKDVIFDITELEILNVKTDTDHDYKIENNHLTVYNNVLCIFYIRIEYVNSKLLWYIPIENDEKDEIKFDNTVSFHEDEKNIKSNECEKTEEIVDKSENLLKKNKFSLKNCSKVEESQKNEEFKQNKKFIENSDKNETSCSNVSKNTHKELIAHQKTSPTLISSNKNFHKINLVYIYSSTDELKLISPGTLLSYEEEDDLTSVIYEADSTTNLSFTIGTYSRYEIIKGDERNLLFISSLYKNHNFINELIEDCSTIIKYIEYFIQKEIVNINLVFCVCLDVLDYYEVGINNKKCKLSYNTDFFNNNIKNLNISNNDSVFTNTSDIFYNTNNAHTNIYINSITSLPFSNEIEPRFILKRTLSSIYSTSIFNLNIHPHDKWITTGLKGYLEDHCVRLLLGNNEFLYQYKQDKDFVTKNDVYEYPLSSELRQEYDTVFYITKCKLVFHTLESNLSKAFVSKIISQVVNWDNLERGNSTIFYSDFLEEENIVENENFEKTNSENLNFSQKTNFLKKHSLSKQTSTTLNAHTFISLIKDITGKDMKDFFEYYIYKPGLLKLLFSFTLDTKKNKVDYKLTFTPTSKLYNCNILLPYPISITSYEIEGSFDHILNSDHFYYHIRTKKKKKEVEEEVMPLLWMRLDTKREHLIDGMVEQPDYMYIEQVLDKNVIGQYEGLAYFSNLLYGNYDEDYGYDDVDRRGDVNHNNSIIIHNDSINNNNEKLNKTKARKDGNNNAKNIKNVDNISKNKEDVDYSYKNKKDVKSNIKNKIDVDNTIENNHIEHTHINKYNNFYNSTTPNLNNIFSKDIAETLERTLENTHNYYKIRIRVLYIINNIFISEYTGYQRIIQYFTKKYFVQSSTIIKPNEFVFTNYFIQKHLVRSLSFTRENRLEYQDKYNFNNELNSDKCINNNIYTIYQFIMNILRYNDNSINSYSDSYYISTCIDSLCRVVLILLDENKFINEIKEDEKEYKIDSEEFEEDIFDSSSSTFNLFTVEDSYKNTNNHFETNQNIKKSSSDTKISSNLIKDITDILERYRILDIIFPSHNNIVTQSCLYTYGRLCLYGYIGLNLNMLHFLSKYPNNYKIRRGSTLLLILLGEGNINIDDIMNVLLEDKRKLVDFYRENFNSSFYHNKMFSSNRKIKLIGMKEMRKRLLEEEHIIKLKLEKIEKNDLCGDIFNAECKCEEGACKCKEKYSKEEKIKSPNDKLNINLSNINYSNANKNITANIDSNIEEMLICDELTDELLSKYKETSSLRSLESKSVGDVFIVNSDNKIMENENIESVFNRNIESTFDDLYCEWSINPISNNYISSTLNINNVSNTQNNNLNNNIKTQTLEEKDFDYENKFEAIKIPSKEEQTSVLFNGNSDIFGSNINISGSTRKMTSIEDFLNINENGLNNFGTANLLEGINNFENEGTSNFQGRTSPFRNDIGNSVFKKDIPNYYPESTSNFNNGIPIYKKTSSFNTVLPKDISNFQGIHPKDISNFNNTFKDNRFEDNGFVNTRRESLFINNQIVPGQTRTYDLLHNVKTEPDQTRTFTKKSINLIDYLEVNTDYSKTNIKHGPHIFNNGTSLYNTIDGVFNNSRNVDNLIGNNINSKILIGNNNINCNSLINNNNLINTTNSLNNKLNDISNTSNTITGQLTNVTRINQHILRIKYHTLIRLPLRKKKKKETLKNNNIKKNLNKITYKLFYGMIHNLSIRQVNKLIFKNKQNTFFEWTPKTLKEIELLLNNENKYLKVCKEIERSLVFSLTYSVYNSRTYKITKKIFDNFELKYYENYLIPEFIIPMSNYRKKCCELLYALITDDYFSLFRSPVDLTEIEKYIDIVRYPMCLLKIQSKMNMYTTVESFFGDLKQIYKNCLYYNQKDSEIVICAKRFWKKVNEFYNSIGWMKIDTRELIQFICGDKGLYMYENKIVRTVKQLIDENVNYEESVYYSFNVYDKRVFCWGV